MTDFKGKIRTK